MNHEFNNVRENIVRICYNSVWQHIMEKGFFMKELSGRYTRPHSHDRLFNTDDMMVDVLRK